MESRFDLVRQSPYDADSQLLRTADVRYECRNRLSLIHIWAVKEGNTSAAVTIAAADPIHPNNPHYAVLAVSYTHLFWGTNDRYLPLFETIVPPKLPGMG